MVKKLLAAAVLAAALALPALDAVQAGAGAAVELRGIPDVGEERHPRAVGGERLDDVDRDAPGVDVQHRVGEEPPVVGGDAKAGVGRAGGEVEGLLAGGGGA